MFDAIKDLALHAVVAIKLRGYMKELDETERFVGIKPRFGYLGGFLSGNEQSLMTKYWQGAGIPIRGTNYWTFGPPTQCGASSRFDPESKFYQAWFGSYVHCGTDGMQFGMNGNEPDINVLKRLSEVDQTLWLKGYGDPAPVARLDTFEPRDKIRVDNHVAWVYYGEIASHSDVGFHGKGYEGAYGIARKMRLKSDAKVGRDIFVPKPELCKGKVEPHHNVLLKGLFTVVPLGAATLSVYINGAEFADNKGAVHDTWRLLEGDALDIIRDVKIRTVC